MFKVLFTVLKGKKYLTVAFLAFLAMAVSSYYLMVVNVYSRSLIVYSEMNGFVFTVVSSVLGLINSLLFGSCMALLFFRIDIVRSLPEAKGRLSGLGGAAINIIASGCPSCGMPVLALLGFPLAVLSLPLEGLELKFLSAIFLLWSLRLISQNIKQSLACERKGGTSL